MTSIQFYHLTTSPLERALPKLLEKCVAGGFTTQVIAANDDQLERLNQLLWTYDANSFLPHGSLKDGNTDDQPILLLTAPHFSPRLRGEPEGGDTKPLHGKIGEGAHSSRKPEALAHAKELRANTTEAENKLWYFLQKENLGCSFRRQHPVGDYIADFACIEKNLLIELDGPQHAENRVYDNKRSEFLEQAGYKVMRFWNNEVLENTEGVLQKIVEALERAEAHPPSPPASRGVSKGLVLVITDGSQPDNISIYERILDIFDGENDSAVQAARTRWSTYKSAGHSVTYRKQTAQGGWEEKAA